MRYSDLYPPDPQSPQLLYCKTCSGYLTLIYDEFYEVVDKVDIRIKDFPFLYCGKCRIKYLSNKNRIDLIMAYEQSLKNNRNEFHSTRRKPDKKFNFCPNVLFDYDSDDYYHLPGLQRPIDEGFLTPVFFMPTVLIKYSNHPDYTVKMYSRTYGGVYRETGHLIDFGINENHKCIMWLGDIDELEENEQHYLKSENISSDHNIGSEFYEGQIDCVFTELPIEDKLIKLRSEFSNCFWRLLSRKPYTLESEVLNIIRDYSKPVVFTPKELKHLYDTLNKIIIESLNDNDLKYLLKSYEIKHERLGSIKKLQYVMSHIFPNENIPSLLCPFFVLYDLRIRFLHILSDKEQNEILMNCRNRLGIATDNTSDEIMYNILLNNLCASYETMILLIQKQITP